MAINRRSFLCGLAATGFINFSHVIASAANWQQHFIATARDRLSGEFVLTCIDEKLEVIWDCTLPGRAHDIVLSDKVNEGVVIARRPGLFAQVFNIDNGNLITTITPAPGRHFYGHGIFSRDGSTLYMTENAYDNGSGIVGVYDAENQYRRIDEFKSGGIGPHEMALLHDGHTLAIANGGILTHPDTGREKLNLKTMMSSMTFVDSRNGRMIKNVSISGADRQSLSIRHMAVTKNDIVVGCQDQSALNDQPLIYKCDALGQSAFVPLDMPDVIKTQFSGYCGSVAYDAGSSTIVVTSPIGGAVGIWDVADNYTWVGDMQMPDGCGAAENPEHTGFVLSSGEGVLSLISSDGTIRAHVNYPFRQWDNHLISV